ncbi:MAG TPA: FdtA/QdtA family cupin domain-containing protein [Bryobacteraceae bacterium]|jgi:dTDP-4-dehydrorhamnose 3,5-epimerase-like enzyme|nr:FdtA/QdtA family cupin domain-containing protein [Bryobacteraceae bacterium]
MLVQNCRLIAFPEVADRRGRLTFFEAERSAPFPIRRVFCIYGVTPGESRGGHAHRQLHQLLVCLAGSFDVIVDDGLERARFHLDCPTRGLYIPPLIWDTEINFAPGSVCMVLASDYYDETDYFRDYSEYVAAVEAARIAALVGG